MRQPLRALCAWAMLLAPVGVAGGLADCAVDGCTLSAYANDPRCLTTPQSDITLLSKRLSKTTGGRLYVQVKNLASGDTVVATLGPDSSNRLKFTMSADGSGYADVMTTMLASIPAGPLGITIQAGTKTLTSLLHIYIPASFPGPPATASSTKGQPTGVYTSQGHAFFYEDSAGNGVVEEYAVSGSMLVVQATRQALFTTFTPGTLLDISDGSAGTVVKLTSMGANPYSLESALLPTSATMYSKLKMLSYTKAWAVAVERKSTMVAVAGEGTDGPLKLFTLPAMGQTLADVPLVGAPAGKQPIALAWGDVDGDSLSDLVAIHSGDNSLAIYLQKSGQGLTYDANLSAALQGAAALQGGMPVALAVGDIDRDGLDDVLFAQNMQILQLANEGSGTFSKTTLLSAPADAIAVGDVNGDGKADLALAQKATSMLAVYTNLAP